MRLPWEVNMSANKELAVVVGATGAFGQAIVAKLCASGLDVVAVARSAAAIDALASRHPGVNGCVADIASDESIAQIAAALDRPVRMIVHGPGVAVAGGILDAPTTALLANASRQLSLAYGSRGITAHLIAPGPADTERLHRVAADRAALRGISTEAVLAEMCAESSIGAFTTPEQVAWAVSMLLAPEADAMTGSTLMLDSGRRRGLP